jgi:hypothetical protein
MRQAQVRESRQMMLVAGAVTTRQQLQEGGEAELHVEAQAGKPGR